MCFVNDHEWYAGLSEETEGPALGDTRCDECYRKILKGQECYNLSQQEHEICSECENGYCNCPKDADGDCLDCKCEEPNYGESFEYTACNDCRQFLKAVETAELEAGCALHHSRPHLMEMINEINEGGSDEAEKYFVTAERLFPHLLTLGYLNFIHNKMFYEDWPLCDEPTIIAHKEFDK